MALMLMTIAVKERGKTMSISKYAYNPDVCDGKPCPGDCDFCRLWLDRVDEGAEQEYEDELQEERKEAGVKDEAEHFWRYK